MTDAEKMLNRLAGLCSRSEQCSHDIMEKLRKSELTSGECADVLGRLRELGFVDDRRFARSYATDKVRFAGWGKRKISAHLAAKRIPRDLIDEALAAINTDDYKEAVIRCARAKGKSLDMHIAGDRAKLLRHMASRGFEPELCLKVMEAIIKRLP